MTLSAQNVSFSSNKVTLKSAFEKIEKESKYKIAYNSSQLDANRSVTLTKKSDDVFGMLNQLLSPIFADYISILSKLRRNTADIQGIWMDYHDKMLFL